jgi:hypothetical protein
VEFTAAIVNSSADFDFSRFLSTFALLVDVPQSDVDFHFDPQNTSVLIISVKVPSGDVKSIVEKAANLTPAQLTELGVSSVKQEVPVSTTRSPSTTKGSAAANNDNDGWSTKRIEIVAGAAGGGFLLILILVGMVCYRRSKRRTVAGGSYHRSFAHQELSGLNEITIRGAGDAYI